MNFKANHAKRLAEIFFTVSSRESSSSTIVVTYTPSSVSSSRSGAAASHSERRTNKQPYACAVTGSKLGAAAKAFASALRVQLVADALGVPERALELRVCLARRLAQHAQCFVDSASEADVWPTGGSPVNLIPAPSLAAPRRPRRAPPPPSALRQERVRR